jgi:hypothetical protein
MGMEGVRVKREEGVWLGSGRGRGLLTMVVEKRRRAA